MKKWKVLLLMCVCIALYLGSGCNKIKITPQMQRISDVCADVELLNYVSETTDNKTQNMCFNNFGEFSQFKDIFTTESDSIPIEQSLLYATIMNVTDTHAEYIELLDDWGDTTVIAISGDNVYYKIVIDRVPIEFVKMDTLYYVGSDGVYNQVDNVDTSEMLFTAWSNSLSYVAMTLRDSINQCSVVIADKSYIVESYKIDEHCDTVFAGYLFDLQGNLCGRYIDGQWYNVNVFTTKVPVDIFKVA